MACSHRPEEAETKTANHKWTRINTNEIASLHCHCRADFAFETTLSGPGDVGRLHKWKAAGYSIEMEFLRLHFPQLALRRIAARVKQGGHHVPRPDVLRRFVRGWRNF